MFDEELIDPHGCCSELSRIVNNSTEKHGGVD